MYTSGRTLTVDRRTSHSLPRAQSLIVPQDASQYESAMTLFVPSPPDKGEGLVGQEDGITGRCVPPRPRLFPQLNFYRLLYSNHFIMASGEVAGAGNFPCAALPRVA